MIAPGFPRAWPTATIGGLLDPTHPRALVIGPFGSHLKVDDYRDAGVPVVFVRNVRPMVYEHSGQVYVSQSKALALAAHRVDAGDLVITKMGQPPCVAAAYPSTMPPGIVTADIIRLVPDPAKVSDRFLLHYLNSPLAKGEVSRFTFGVTRPKVKLSDFRSLPVPLPPLTEQRRIADILDRADTIRRKRRAAIALTEDLLRSTFLDMFGDPVTNPKSWPTTTLGMQAASLKYGTSQKCTRTPLTDGWPVLRIPNVASERLDWSDLKYTRLDGKALDAASLVVGDLLFVRTNGNPNHIGRCAVFDGARPAAYASYLIRARFKASAAVRPAFVRDQMSVESYRHRLIREARTTAGNYNINTKGLARLALVVPPLSLQDRYLERVGAIESAAAKQRSFADEADTLLHALTQRAFRGDL